MVRASATGDIRISDWGRVLGRELVVAILLGLSMAAAIAVIGVFRGGPDIAIVIALSMVVIVIVGSMIGMLLPFILSRFNMDPATASTPLVTSIADATGVLIYFSITKAVLGSVGIFVFGGIVGKQGVPLCLDAKNLRFPMNFSTNCWLAAPPVRPSSKAACWMR